MFYLCSAVNSRNGGSFSLFTPNVNTDCINIFLEQISQYLKTRKVFLIMVSWHKSKNLKVPKNIEIIYLPLCSPELNSIEKLWLYINRTFCVIKSMIQLLCLKALCASLLSLFLTPQLNSSAMSLI
ncbi:hypothetical protein GO684_00530 [Wolbachia endosymbiont of Litomosoides brasiliensis]|nr:hypothetical protein [Wolbachia endosymbiont of Litomosoides brasiliensis]